MKIKHALIALLLLACAPIAYGQESEHKRAGDAWVKKDYDSFVTHAENFILLYPKHDYVPNLEYRVGMARAFQGKYKEALEVLYRAAKKNFRSPSGLIALEDAQTIEGSYTTQPEALAALMKAIEIKLHVSAELKKAEHDSIKAALDKAAAVKGVHGPLAARIDYEKYVVEERELKQEYTAYYPDIKPDLLLANWETFEAAHSDDEFAFKGFINRVKLYGWLANPFEEHSPEFKPRVEYYDRGVELARDRVRTDKDPEHRRLLLYRLAKLLKAKQFGLVTVNSDATFNVLKEAMDTYETLLKEAPDWYLVIDVLSDMVDLKCLVAQYDDAYSFAYDHASHYQGDMEYGQVYFTLFKYMSLAKSKYLLKKSLLVFKTLAQGYGTTTYFTQAMEHDRQVQPLYQEMGVFIEEVLGTGGAKSAEPKTRVEVPAQVRAPEKENPTFMTGVGKFLILGLIVLVALTALLFIAERLRQKEELEKIEKEYDKKEIFH